MINVTARSESSPQTLGYWDTYSADYPNAWWEIRLVGWISQNASTLKTTLYFKWQVGSYNYWPFWDDPNTYRVTLGDDSKTTSFNLAQDTSNTYKDKSSVQSITVTHNSDGTYSGTIEMEGYKCWESFSYEDEITFPKITPPAPTPTPTPTPDPEPIDEIYEPVPPINDDDPKYYIYADGEVLYTSNDENYLVIEPRLSLALNQTDSLEFILPPTHPRYNSLAKLRSTVEVRQGSEILFRGRVLNDSRDFDNKRHIHCEGALSFLNDTLMPPYAAGDYKTAAALFKAALTEHGNQVPKEIPERRLRYVFCNVSAEIENENSEYSSTNEVISTLLNDVGGYLKLEYYDNGETGLSYLNSYNRVSSQPIQFGVNLLDLTQSIDASEVYTSVVCLGAADENTGKRLTTGDGNDIYIEDRSAINVFGRIIRTFTYDDITDRNELKKVANALLKLGTSVKMTFEVKAVDMHLISPDVEKFRLGDSIPIKAYPHNVDSYIQCTGVDIDLQNPENTTYTLGGTITALTDTTSRR